MLSCAQRPLRTLADSFVHSEIFPYLVVVIGFENVLVLTKSVVSTPVDLEVKLRIAQGNLGCVPLVRMAPRSCGRPAELWWRTSGVCIWGACCLHHSSQRELDTGVLG